MSVDLSGLPRDVRVQVGERFVIPLPSYSGSGNTWSVAHVAGQEIARVLVESAEAPPLPVAPPDGAAPPPALVLVPERVVGVGLAPGEATFRLVLSRQFGPATPSATFDFHLTVLAAR